MVLCMWYIIAVVWHVLQHTLCDVVSVCVCSGDSILI